MDNLIFSLLSALISAKYGGHMSYKYIFQYVFLLNDFAIFCYENSNNMF